MITAWKWSDLVGNEPVTPVTINCGVNTDVQCLAVNSQVGEMMPCMYLWSSDSVTYRQIECMEPAEMEQYLALIWKLGNVCL